MFDQEFAPNPFNLRLTQRCPVCKADQASAQLEILEELGSSFLAYLSCSRCGAALIVRVMTMPQGLVGNAILTELSSDEVMKFAGSPIVSHDDVLEVWQTVKDGSYLSFLTSRNLPKFQSRRSLPKGLSEDIK